jgi:hypothetical protein
VHLVGGFVVVFEIGRVFLIDPAGPLDGVKAEERQHIAANLIGQLGQQRRRQPLGRDIAAVVADDAQQGAQVALTDRHGRRHGVPLPGRSPLYTGPWPGHT